jgi:hypothetical protein
MHKLDEHGAGVGYRLAGPMVSSSGKVLLTKTLDADDAEAIRSFLDEVFPSRYALDRAAQAIMAAPEQPKPGEPPSAAQQGALAEAATERLRQLASSGPLSAEEAISLADSLRAVLDHIGETLSILPALAKAYRARETSGQSESAQPSAAADNPGTDQGGTAALPIGPEFLGPSRARRTATPAVRPRGTTGSPSLEARPALAVGRALPLGPAHREHLP